jgi:hypothetical membrane protein
MPKLENFFGKVHEAYFAFIGLIIFLIGLIPAIVVEPGFNFLVTHISDLGAPSNQLYIFFDICWFITGIFMMFFLLGFTSYLQKKGASSKPSWIAFILGILSALGILMLAIFNSETSPDMHLISEYLFFFTGILYLFLYTFIELKLANFSKIQALFNIIVALFFLLYLLILLLNKFKIVLTPELQSVSEWLFLFANLFWFLENGLYALKHK